MEAGILVTYTYLIPTEDGGAGAVEHGDELAHPVPHRLHLLRASELLQYEVAYIEPRRASWIYKVKI